jgi:lysophospholipase L1-like esterase
MSLSITGFGACMIAGFPLPAEKGFLHHAAQQLRRDRQRPVELNFVTMGGFPAPRAHKHFAKRVLTRRPDVLVLQFGSTDASAPLRNAFFLRRSSHKTGRGAQKVSDQPPSAIDLAKWRLRSLASDLLLVPPLTSLDEYLAAVLAMAAEGRAAGSAVVVLSPFRMGGNRSDRFARRYTRALAQRLPEIPGAHFLDAHALLSRWPRRQMLLRDGFHLSAEAHQRLGVALAEVIKTAAGNATKTATDFAAVATTQVYHGTVKISGRN